MTALLSASACICVIALNFLATARVMRDTTLSDNHRMLFLAAIWLLPVVGAGFALLTRPRNA